MRLSIAALAAFGLDNARDFGSVWSLWIYENSGDLKDKDTLNAFKAAVKISRQKANIGNIGDLVSGGMDRATIARVFYCLATGEAPALDSILDRGASVAKRILATEEAIAKRARADATEQQNTIAGE